MNILKALVCLSPLVLGGCAETLARAITEGEYLHQAADAYVRENHELRRQIRKECRASLVREIDDMKQTGDEQALRKMLASVYPSLVTIELVSTALNNPKNLLTKVPGCGEKEAPEVD